MSDRQTTQTKQLAIMWAALASLAVAVSGAAFVVEAHVWEPAGRAMHFVGAMGFVSTAPIMARLVSSLPRKMEYGAVATVGVLMLVIMGVAYRYQPSVLEPIMELVVVGTLVLAFLVVLHLAEELIKIVRRANVR